MKTYKGWTEAEMRQLAERLDALKGQWVLTVDDSSFNRKLFSACQLMRVQRPNGCRNQKDAHNREAYGELIVRAPRS